MGVTVREKVKGSGDYWVFVNHNGFRKAKHAGSLVTAEELAEQLRAMIVLGKLTTTSPPTVNAPTLHVYSKTWLEDQVAGILDDATHERYGLVLTRDILPALGTLTIDQIEPKHVRNLLNKLSRDGRTTKSIALTRTVLCSCLNEAVIDGLMKTNPVKVVMRNSKRSKTTEARRPIIHRVNPFTPKEVARFIDWVMANEPDVYGPMFLCAFMTGLRLGELIGLHWDDIDWEHNLIHVRKGYNRGKVKQVKNGEERTVDMSDQLKVVLAELLKQRKLAAAKTGGWQLPEMIFHYDGHYRAQNTVRKAFKTCLKRAKLRAIRVHDMRHTYASLLISMGVSLAYVKEQLGHSSIKTTVDIYGHLVPRSMQHVVNELDHVINDNTTK